MKHSKKKTLSDLCHEIEVNDTNTSIASLGDALRFGDIMHRHNDYSNEFHFSDPHAVICIGNVDPDAAGE